MAENSKYQVTDLKPEDFFYLLSDMTRLRCLILIYKRNELCVCDLTDVLKISQPKVSRHLSLLRKYDIVKFKRKGIWIYYSINPKIAAWAKEILKNIVNRFIKTNPYASDLKIVLEYHNNCSRCGDQ